MGRAQQKPSAVTDAFAPAFGTLRGEVRARRLQTALEQERPFAILDALALMRPDQVPDVLSKFSQMLDTGERGDHLWIFEVPGKAPDTSGSQWGNWNEELEGLLVEELADTPSGHPFTQALDALEGHWETLPRCWDVAQAYLQEAEHNIEVANWVDDDTDIGREALQSVRADIATGDANKVFWRVLGDADIDQGSRLYTDTRDELLMNLPAVHSPRSLMMLLEKQAETEDYPFDPVMLDAVRNLPTPLFVQQFDIAIDTLDMSTSDAGMPARQAIVDRLAALYADPDIAPGSAADKKRRDYRKTVRDSLSLPHNAAAARSASGQSLFSPALAGETAMTPGVRSETAGR